MLSNKLHLTIFFTLLVLAAALFSYFATLHVPTVDEAVFGRSSLEIIGGDWNLSEWRAMKPFMVYYVQAISRMIFGISAFSGRIPGILATLGCLILLFRFSRRWFDSETGLLAVALMIVSPFTLYHFPNGRTDAIAMFFVMLAIDRAGARQYGWAGFAYSLSFCTRQLVALSFPLVMIFAFYIDYISNKEPRIDPKSYVQITWKFFKGTLPALTVLFIWSLFEKIPFAWLVHEMSFDKYKIGPHRALGYFEKLDYWMRGVFEFFGFTLPAVLACIAVIAACLVIVPRLAGKWDFHSNTKMAIAFLLSAFVLLFVLVHSAKFFNTKYRFLVPIVPWVMLLAAWFWMEVFRNFIDRSKRFGRAAGIIFLSVFFVSASAYQVQNVIAMSAPIPHDDIPIVVQWIDKNTNSDSMLLSNYGPEMDYAVWNTKVKPKQLKKDMGRLIKYSVKHLGIDIFVYLSPQQIENYFESISKKLHPRFVLYPVSGIDSLLGQLYRVEVANVGGIDNNEIRYWQKGQMVTAKFDCETVGALFVKAISKGTDADTTLHWQSCEPSEKPDELSWSLDNFKVGKLEVADALFEYQAPEIDWTILTVAKRLVLKNAVKANGVINLDGEDLARFIQKKNKNLENLAIEIGEDGLQITGTTRLLGSEIPVVVKGSLDVKDDKIFFRLHFARAGKRSVPAFLLPYIEGVMNPVFKIDLNRFFLKAESINTSPASNSLTLVATKKAKP